MESVLIVGMGRFGSTIATELYQMNYDVLAIEKIEHVAASYTDKVTEIIIGNGQDERLLKTLGVQNFDCVIVAIAHTLEDSIVTTMMLKEMGAKFLVCKADNEIHAKILASIGVQRIIRPEYDMGRYVAKHLIKNNLQEFKVERHN